MHQQRSSTGRRRLAEILARIARRIATENPDTVTLAGGAVSGATTSAHKEAGGVL